MWAVSHKSFIDIGVRRLGLLCRCLLLEGEAHAWYLLALSNTLNLMYLIGKPGGRADSANDSKMKCRQPRHDVYQHRSKWAVSIT